MAFEWVGPRRMHMINLGALRRRPRPSRSAAAEVAANRMACRTYRLRRLGAEDKLPPMPTRCECCGRRRRGKSLHADHCHRTGKFRGWICNSCNTGIGMLGDTRAGIRRAIAYLRRSKK